MSRIAISAAILIATCSCSFVKVNPNSFESSSTKVAVSPRKAVKGAGAIQTKTYDLAAFDQIKCNLFADITFTQTEGEQYVEIETFENIFDRLNIYVENGKLFLKTEPKVRYDKMKIRIGAPCLRDISVNCSGDVDIPGGLSTDSFGFSINGAGDIDVKGLTAGSISGTVNGAGDASISGVNAGKVSMCINGAGDIELSGKCEEANLNINGAGDIDVVDLETGNCYTKISGSGKVKRK